MWTDLVHASLYTTVASSTPIQLFSIILFCSFSRKPRKGKGKGQKRKRKKNRDKKQDLYVNSAFSTTHLHTSVMLLVIKLFWEEIICLL